jgi:pimeloyl-ACP methyl ester carboxylesterase
VTAHPERVAGFVAVAPVDLPSYESALRKLALPTLIVWGEQDQVVPVAQANALHGWVKDSQLVDPRRRAAPVLSRSARRVPRGADRRS